MSYLLLGLCSLSKLSVMGAIYLMLAHGFTSAGLFYLIGCLYARYHTRLIFYYGGLITMMPCFSIFLFFFILANISFPGTSNFISECLILIGILNDNYFVFSLLLFFIIFTAIYSL
jgi:NADH-quinone oxidoreductase subunit M